MDLQPTAKRLRHLDSTLCIICNKSLGKGKESANIVKSPTQDGLKVLFEACEIRKDDVHDRLLPFKDDILQNHMHVSYHKSCRLSYVSKSNLKHVPAKHDCDDSQSQPTCSSSSTAGARSGKDITSAFNIRRDCFICGKVWKKGHEKLTNVVTGTGQSTRDKVLSAATAQHDEVVKLRMTAYNDLFAYNAKYHRSCLGHYLSKRNIEAEQRKDKDSQHQSKYEKAFNFIIEDIEGTILSKHKSVTTLSQIRSNFLAKLNALDIDVEVYSWKLKAKLRNHFADRLVFIERRGVSDLVCSSTVTVGDALRKASELQNLQQEDSTDLFEEPDTSHVNEIQLLHSAAGILRRHMSNIVEAKHHYDPSSKIGIDPCAKFEPDLMYDFFMWLTVKVELLGSHYINMRCLVG